MEVIHGTNDLKSTQTTIPSVLSLIHIYLKLKATHMKSLSFRKDLVEVQGELLRFAYKLTTDREEANDLLQETSLKALDNEDKYMPDTNFKGWMLSLIHILQIQIFRFLASILLNIIQL